MPSSAPSIAAPVLTPSLVSSSQSSSSPSSSSGHHEKESQQQGQSREQQALLEQQLCSSSGSSIPDDRLAAIVAAAEVAASMYDAYQAWALKTYGDSAKTKTVTRKKYNRIMKILRGEECSSVENSKFRFWVKAKGFKIAADLSEDSEGEQVLYVPATKPGASSSPSSQITDFSAYKRVAVVENFYDIIYNVHVEMDGRSGKHAGQKRTYRAVAEMFAFLPREAVTRFLMSCSDCQKRMHLQYNPASSSNIFPPSQSSPLPRTYQSKLSKVTNNRSNSTCISNSINNRCNSSVSSFSPDDDDGQSGGLIVDTNDDDDDDQEGVLLVDDRSNGELYNYTSNGTNINGNKSATKSPTNHISKEGTSLKRKRNGTSTAKNSKKPRKSSVRVQEGKENESHELEECASDRIAKNSDERLEDEEADDLDGNEIEEELMEPTIDEDDDVGEEEAAEKESPASVNPEAAKQLAIQGKNEEEASLEGGVEKGHHHTNDLLGLSPSSLLDQSSSSSSSIPLDMRKKRVTAKSSVKKSNHSTGPRTPVQNGIQGKKLASSSSKTTSGSKGDKVTGKGSKSAPSSSSSEHMNSSVVTQEETLEEKMKTREKLLAALTALNGQHRGVRTSVQSLSAQLSHDHDEIKVQVPADDDDEDEDEEESDSIILSGKKGEVSPRGSFDAERLKAFNMFVRLFVDENLDRMVPISRQPKEKIQAIIDSCARQFPEFPDRPRKRIRTYLKSCRRTRRHKIISPTTKDGSRDDEDDDDYVEKGDSVSQPLITCTQLSSSSYHLTSPLAEQILATACDNEYQNVKRMSLGLQPIATHIPDSSLDVNGSRINGDKRKDSLTCSSVASSVASSVKLSLANPSSFNGHLHGALMSSQVSPVFSSSSSSMSALQAFKPVNSAHSTSSLLAALCQQKQSESTETKHINNHIANETEDVMSGGINSKSGNEAYPITIDNQESSPIAKALNKACSMTDSSLHSILPCHARFSLNPSEVAAVKILISGYRESAAFLLRSADELEQLLHRQV